jgi:hypothetical protein
MVQSHDDVENVLFSHSFINLDEIKVQDLKSEVQCDLREDVGLKFLLKVL